MGIHVGLVCYLLVGMYLFGVSPSYPIENRSADYLVVVSQRIARERADHLGSVTKRHRTNQSRVLNNLTSRGSGHSAA
jgi:hypothetical protein